MLDLNLPSGTITTLTYNTRFEKTRFISNYGLILYPSSLFVYRSLYIAKAILLVLRYSALVISGILGKYINPIIAISIVIILSRRNTYCYLARLACLSIVL